MAADLLPLVQKNETHCLFLWQWVFDRLNLLKLDQILLPKASDDAGVGYPYNYANSDCALAKHDHLRGFEKLLGSPRRVNL